MKTGLIVTVVLVIIAGVNRISAQENLGASITLPSFEARLSLGFNYDLLKLPTAVSFENPMGYMGINIPLNRSFNIRDMAGQTDSIFSDTTLFRNGADFQPKAIARQNPNNSVMVTVPMMGGVGSFSYTQNFLLDYETILGNPSISISPELDEGMSFLLRGTINVPLSLSLGWETMSFGYAHRVDRNFSFAFNISRHLFYANLKGRVDMNLLGNYNIHVDSAMAPIYGEIDYPSEKVNGYALGAYDAEVWSPSIGAQFWRFSLASRFGFSTKARGSLEARYYLPAFIDPETFEIRYDLSDPDVLMDPDIRDQFLSNAVDSVGYSTENRLHWRIPHAHTLSALVLDRTLAVSLSYTKLFGEIEMRLEDILKEQNPAGTRKNKEGVVDSIGVDLGVKVDHVIVLHGNLLGAFLNAGVFAFDLKSGERENILGENMPKGLGMGDAAMIPILNMGAVVGAKIQLKVQLNLLPLPAFKSGLYYHF